MREEKKPFFSVIVPVYNKEPHIARSINSILNQTFTDFELIIVCDPSTDNSNAEVAKFTDPRVRVFYRDEPGPGGYAARNLGIKNAKADWVAFLDADDEWYPEHLAVMKEGINLGEYKFIASRYEIIGGRVKNNTPTTDSVFQNISFSEYLKFSPFYTSSVVTRKDILKQSGKFPAGKANRGGDVDTWLRCIYISGGYTLVNRITARYYVDSVSMVTRLNPYTKAEIELQYSTIKEIIEKESSGLIKNELKIKSNKQVIYSWNQNMHNSYKSDFNLNDYIYVSDDFIRGVFFILFSKMPVCLATPVHRVLFKLITIKRGLLSKKPTA